MPLDFFGRETLKKAAGKIGETQLPANPVQDNNPQPAGLDIAKMAQETADKMKSTGSIAPSKPDKKKLPIK